MRKNVRRASGGAGFTLLEVLVALQILGIAIAVILQLFSANIRGISHSRDYVNAAIRAESRLREIVHGGELSEGAWSETLRDGGGPYRMDVSIDEVMTEKTGDIGMRLFEITLTVNWLRGGKAKSLTLATMKLSEGRNG